MAFLEGHALFRNLYCLLAGNLDNTVACSGRGGLLPVGWEWLAFAITAFAITMVLLNVFLVVTMFYTYMERRLLGRFQGRLGPNRAGPFGLLQPVADAIKLLTKESIVPRGTDLLLHNLPPVIMVATVFVTLAILPFGEDTFVANLNVGVLFFLAITSVNALAIFMAGLSSGNRYAVFSGMRAVAQLISYEVPMVLSVVGVILLAGSLSLVEIVEAQRIPFFLLQPLGLFIFVVAISAEMNRTPFDQLEAESEIVAGFHTEYTGMKFGLFYLAEYAAVLTSAAVIVTLFLDGWNGPWLPSPLWFLIKVFFLAFLFIWVRATLPRLRIDQTMAFAWKFLLPLSLLNIFVTATLVLLLGEETATGVALSTGGLWAMAGINSVVALASVLLFARMVHLRTPVHPIPSMQPSPSEVA
ncbi:MAG: NADH-quinone oxidoreductase subunit NuoH [Chloroflexi bacterium]|nr:NADH-quinone oxidoreductase subunit NuoH [Chloroflexota bacterium]